MFSKIIQTRGQRVNGACLKKKSAGHGVRRINAVGKLGYRPVHGLGSRPSLSRNIRSDSRRHRRTNTGRRHAGMGPPSHPAAARAGSPSGLCAQGLAERQPRLLIDCSDFIRHNERSRRCAVIKQTYPAWQLTLRSRCDADACKSDQSIARYVMASLVGLLGLACSGRPRSNWPRTKPPADRDPVFLRSSDRCQRRPFRAGRRPTACSAPRASRSRPTSPADRRTRSRASPPAPAISRSSTSTS